jgi:hypothetical protein
MAAYGIWRHSIAYAPCLSAGATCDQPVIACSGPIALHCMQNGRDGIGAPLPVRDTLCTYDPTNSEADREEGVCAQTQTPPCSVGAES